MTSPLDLQGGSAPVIAVVSPPPGDRAMTEALNRFRGEATAVGFVVTLVSALRGSPSAQMEFAARAVPGVATVAFVRGGEPTELDVWFTDRLDGQTLVDHVSVESNRADRAVVLAVKAVDVLRARMFGLLARRGDPGGAGSFKSSVAATRGGGEPTSAATSAEAPVAVEEVASRAPARARDWSPSREPPETIAATGGTVGATDRGSSAVAVGAGALRGFSGLSASLLLIVRGEYAVTRTNSVRVALGSVATRAAVDAPAGRALVRHSLLMVDWALRPWGRRLRPMLAVGAGVHYVSAEGVAMPPYQARTVGQLVGAVGVSAGVGAFVTRHIGICLETGIQLLFPELQVSVAGGNPQRGGRPALLATLALEAHL